jgi:cupin 2 domain-containing protein
MTVAAYNLLHPLPDASKGEVADVLVAGTGFRLIRITSAGQASPPGFWYDQDEAEWVMLVEGEAALELEGDPAPRALRAGDVVVLPAGRRHRVVMTAPDRPTVWLALFAAAGTATPFTGA